MTILKRIIIVGHPGAGKAVLAEALAEKLNWDFIDADFGLELQVGWPITNILGKSGNTALRACENHFMTQYLNKDKCVIVTDVGVVLSDNVRTQ